MRYAADGYVVESVGLKKKCGGLQGGRVGRPRPWDPSPASQQRRWSAELDFGLRRRALMLPAGKPVRKTFSTAGKALASTQAS